MKKPGTHHFNQVAKTVTNDETSTALSLDNDVLRRTQHQFGDMFGQNSQFEFSHEAISEKSICTLASTL